MTGRVHLIAAVGVHGQIGLNGKVPWMSDPAFAEHTQRDLAEFARLTQDAVLLVGSVTWADMQAQGVHGSEERPIFVWSRRCNCSPPAYLQRILDMCPGKDIWVCGGESTYELFMPYVDWHHVSVLPYDGPADRFLPPILPAWRPGVPSEVNTLLSGPWGRSPI